MFRIVKVLVVFGIGLGTLATFATAGEQAVWPPGSQTTVVAELFTSEGCSSCPPADQVLARLVDEQPIEGVTVVALGEHVDYWDRLGWRDPFSAQLFSARQSAYDSGVFRTGRIYTPQVVIDGHLEVIGSDESAVHSAVRKAARTPKAQVAVASEALQDGSLRVSVRVEIPSGLSINPAEVMIALTEDRLSTNVRRGENSGRVLSHAAVVRSLASVGPLSLRFGVQTTTASLAVAPAWSRENLRVVAFVQEQVTRRIVGAGSQSVR